LLWSLLDIVFPGRTTGVRLI